MQGVFKANQAQKSSCTASRSQRYCAIRYVAAGNHALQAIDVALTLT
jgi:hypothetical protein